VVPEEGLGALGRRWPLRTIKPWCQGHQRFESSFSTANLLSRPQVPSGRPIHMFSAPNRLRYHDLHNVRFRLR
jgi:hypothetical protein